MASLHLAIVPIAADFCRSRLLINPVTCEEESEGTVKIPPTETETFRIQRALYRFQLFHCLFNNVKGSGFLGLFHPEDMTNLFLSVFNAWEVEEIGCIRDYMLDRYYDFFIEAKNDILRCKPWEGVDEFKREMLEERKYPFLLRCS
jgi:hypothetical protein